MDETTPLVSKKEQQHWLGIKPSPWVLYPAFLFLGTVLGMVQGPFVQFLLDLLCQRMDTSTISERSREECNADSDVQSASSEILMQVQVVASVIGTCRPLFSNPKAIYLMIYLTVDRISV